MNGMCSQAAYVGVYGVREKCNYLPLGQKCIFCWVMRIFCVFCVVNISNVYILKHAISFQVWIWNFDILARKWKNKEIHSEVPDDKTYRFHFAFRGEKIVHYRFIFLQRVELMCSIYPNWQVLRVLVIYLGVNCSMLKTSFILTTLLNTAWGNIQMPQASVTTFICDSTVTWTVNTSLDNFIFWSLEHS